MRFPIVKKREKKSGAKYNKNTIKSEARRDVSGNLRSRDYRDEVVNIFSPSFFLCCFNCFAIFHFYYLCRSGKHLLNVFFFLFFAIPFVT